MLDLAFFISVASVDVPPAALRHAIREVEVQVGLWGGLPRRSCMRGLYLANSADNDMRLGSNLCCHAVSVDIDKVDVLQPAPGEYFPEGGYQLPGRVHNHGEDIHSLGCILQKLQACLQLKGGPRLVGRVPLGGTVSMLVLTVRGVEDDQCAGEVRDLEVRNFQRTLDQMFMLYINII